MRVFRDMELVEQIGSGMSRILEVYDRSIFKFTPNFMTVSFPIDGSFGNGGNESGNDGNESGNENYERILGQITLDPSIRLDDLVEKTNIPKRTVSRLTRKMQEDGVIKRIGSARSGRWEITANYVK
jgi:predicted HTH transcriptional regulator